MQAEIKVLRIFDHSVLASGDESSLAVLKLNSVDFQILDPIEPGNNYYLVYLSGPATFEDLKRHGNILWQNEVVALLKTTASRVADLNYLPVELEKLHFAPVVLAEHKNLITTQILKDTLIQQIVDNVSVDTIRAYIRQLQSYGNRYSTGNARTAANWIRDKFQAFGVDSIEMHNWHASHAPNVVAIRHGTTHRDKCLLILGGHFDTVSISPGANDNASGTVCAMEAARVMNGYQFEYTIHYIAFSGEEFGLLGSTAYASRALSRGDTIPAMINNDMIGYCDRPPENMEIIGKSSAPNCSTLVNFFYTCADTYVSVLPKVKRFQAIGGSDHAPFWSRGYVAICGTGDYPVTDPNYHRPSDTLGAGVNDIVFCTNVIKACVATLAALARPVHADIQEDELLSISTVNKRILKIFPNPAWADIRLQISDVSLKDAKITIYDVTGKRICTRPVGPGSLILKLETGVYFVRLDAGKNTEVQKLVVIK